MTRHVPKYNADQPLVSWRHLEFLLGRKRTDLLQLAAHAARHYRPFDLRLTLGGKWRHIDNPTKGLKTIQRRIQRRILNSIPLPASMFGAVPGRSIRDNAAPHVGQDSIVTLDLMDCFPRTDDRKVFDVYRSLLGCPDDIAGLLTKLTTVRHRVPQGAPTSATLVNLTLLGMHGDLAELTAELGLRLSMYVDDLTFSGAESWRVIEPALEIIARHRHAVRTPKKHIMPRFSQQRVTGATVNSKLSAGRRKLEAIRQEILDLEWNPAPPEYAIRSVLGKIEHVRYLCPQQGRALDRFAADHLPPAGVPGAKPRVGQVVPCRRARSCLWARQRRQVAPTTSEHPLVPNATGPRWAPARPGRRRAPSTPRPLPPDRPAKPL